MMSFEVATPRWLMHTLNEFITVTCKCLIKVISTTNRGSNNWRLKNKYFKWYMRFCLLCKKLPLYTVSPTCSFLWDSTFSIGMLRGYYILICQKLWQLNTFCLVFDSIYAILDSLGKFLALQKDSYSKNLDNCR